MAINFPNSPQAGDPHSEPGVNWVYDGEKWVAQSEATFWARAGSTLSPSTAGDNISTTGDLTDGCTTTGTGGSSGEAKVVGYQEGIWTPTLSFGTANATNSTWFRIGNAVTVYTTLSTFSDASTAQAVRVLSLPYANANAQAMGSAMYRYVNVEGYTTTFVSNEGIYLYGGIAGDWAALFYSNLNSSGGTEMYISGTYLTDNTDWTPINGATIS